MAKTIRVGVEQRLCGSAGICVREAPGLFHFEPGSKRAIAEDTLVPAHLRSTVRSVSARCPFQAIVVDEDDGVST